MADFSLQKNGRANGVLLAVSSLAGNFGIGTLGKSAFEFVDFLKQSAQTFWQVLPLGPTGFGDSPYQSFSTFAGNPYFIDFEILAQEGFLKKSDYENIFWGKNPRAVNYGILYKNRPKIFSLIQENFLKNVPCDFENFCEKNSFWLDDFSLFMAIKNSQDGKSFSQWPLEIRKREKFAMENAKKNLFKKIEQQKILQYFFDKQWKNLKNYADKNGIKIIGDIPIYVAADSADVWSNGEQFFLDKNFNPKEVAGCPPDAFSADGQLWGNPIYNWNFLKREDFSWWKLRVKKCLEFFDVIRIDHFRGFDSFYCIPFGSVNAKNGVWKKGPGKSFFSSLQKTFGDLPFLAEDLGFLTDSVKTLLAQTGFPGMKVLQFAFDSSGQSEYLPFRYEKNCVVYTGTHDNDTILGWTQNAPQNEVQNAMKFLRVKTRGALCREMMICAMSSVANTCILCMQDLIGAGKSARMNTPSTLGKNWQWRTVQKDFSDDVCKFLKENTKLYGR